MIPQDVIEKALSKAQESASHSWEHSTVFEALLEYRNPSYSVFSANPFPNGEAPRLKIEDIDALRYVRPLIRTDTPTLSEDNGSSADPTSLCLPTLLLSLSPSLPPSTQTTYSTALSRQLHTFLNSTPRFPNGALSHRTTHPSLWSDFIYMAPPILAYLGISTHDLSLLGESVRQCELYCQVLRSESGAWRHIANLPSPHPFFPTYSFWAKGKESVKVKQDSGAWSTSNAWAAAGMARVLATLRHSPFAAATMEEQGSLRGMIRGIVDAARRVDSHPSRLLRNYLDDDTAFADVAGTALMAATVFRVVRLQGPGEVVFGGEYTAWATEKMRAVAQHVDAETGVAAPVVNSLREGEEMPLGEVNPEAQAFVVLLFAAWRDWSQAESL
ncbi:hypothetical protein COCMIDRAFT_409 [Bipolaris oryzae ATCC 44560]|uniref:Glycoside hydrolase family 105 protein n=1 Tax=Bipolaris oryzae ATCC 44560 TaxID=930090 RepID=W6ZLM0_COCMI|nr:uncharacterized protein COCMIDRAFT_409 [Bipolaris oryzae ATCC 44560]EUC50858.1 hypothetical protein COCMIDRAFT_409 [Bipolaris oryzae ATCC 44560]